MVDRQAAAREEWQRGWTVVFAALLGVSLGSLHIYSTGLFIEPLEQEFGWSRSQITVGFSMVSFMGVFSAPIVGLMVDRWGSRRIGLPGAFLYCGGFAALSLAGPSIWSWWALWLLFSFTFAGIQPIIWSTSVSARFEFNRGLAIAIAFCGTGLASSFIPILANHLISQLGWRGAYVALGALFLIASAPVLYFFLHDARHQPAKSTQDEAKPAPPPLNGWSVRQGLRSRQFYHLAVAALLITAVIVGFVVHIVPILTDSGLSRETVVKIVGIIGIMSIIGRLTVGFLFDHFPGPPIGMISVGLPMVVSVLLLFFPGSLVFAIIAVIFLGLSVGGEYDAIIYLSTRYFGLRNYGTLFGMVMALLAAGVGLGPLIGGILYDISGDYKLFLMVVIPMSGVASLLIGTLGAYPVHVESEEELLDGGNQDTIVSETFGAKS